MVIYGKFMEEWKESLDKLFSKAGRVKSGYASPEERVRYQTISGARKFKREVLGLCGKESIKSLDEIAEALLRINIAGSLSEARQIVLQIEGANLHCFCGYLIDLEPGCSEYIQLEPVENSKRDIRYKITHRKVDNFL